MTEQRHIYDLFKSGYDGSPWLDVNLAGTLKNIDAEQAAEKISPGINSIWELTNHILMWRKTVLERVNGAITQTPDHNYFFSVADTSQQAWENLLADLNSTQQEWLSFIEQVKEPSFDTVYPVNGHTYYEHILGILQHDVYHLGQIVMLAKHFTGLNKSAPDPSRH